MEKERDMKTEVNTINSTAENKTEDQEKPVLSKRQLKQLEKRKRWLELKPLKRAKEKEKKKLKIKLAKESGVYLGPNRKMLKASKMSDSSCKLRVCFDLSLGHLMTPNEISKTFKQLHRCYSINRRARAPLQLYITGYNEELKCAMNKLSGCFNWDVNFSEDVCFKIFDKSEIVYLTSDSPNVLESFDDTKVYIIGGLVDHNRLKNTCFDKAIQEGVGHARLPLDTYFKFKTRQVLTIDQVYCIILRITEGETWIDAVSNVVPKRKGIELKDDFKDNSHSKLMSDLSESENGDVYDCENSMKDSDITDDSHQECVESKDLCSNTNTTVNNS